MKFFDFDVLENIFFLRELDKNVIIIVILNFNYDVDYSFIF